MTLLTGPRGAALQGRIPFHLCHPISPRLEDSTSHCGAHSPTTSTKPRCSKRPWIASFSADRNQIIQGSYLAENARLIRRPRIADERHRKQCIHGNAAEYQCAPASAQGGLCRIGALDDQRITGGSVRASEDDS